MKILNIAYNYKNIMQKMTHHNYPTRIFFPHSCCASWYYQSFIYSPQIYLFTDWFTSELS